MTNKTSKTTFEEMDQVCNYYVGKIRMVAETLKSDSSGSAYWNAIDEMVPYMEMITKAAVYGMGIPITREMVSRSCEKPEFMASANTSWHFEEELDDAEEGAATTEYITSALKDFLQRIAEIGEIRLNGQGWACFFESEGDMTNGTRDNECTSTDGQTSGGQVDSSIRSAANGENIDSGK